MCFFGNGSSGPNCHGNQYRCDEKRANATKKRMKRKEMKGEGIEIEDFVDDFRFLPFPILQTKMGRKEGKMLVGHKQ
jgi:hypothetical protein